MRAPEFWEHRGPMALLLAPLGLIYGASVALKAKFARPYRCGAKVICVGNLTAGGSGKTPVAIAVATRLIARGRKTFFLTRGYGGSLAGPVLVESQSAAEVGDEALLLARTAPTVVAKDRAEGARFAVARGAEVIVMDDGHQNFSLHKDISLVVVDGLGNGMMIPAGPLRESVAQGLSRADAVVMFGETPLKGFSGAVARAKLEADGLEFAGVAVYAFAGIGRPEKFMQSLEEADAEIAGTRFFDDHHPYSPAEIAGLRAAAKDWLLVTTEKDFVRLAPEQRRGIAVLKVRAVLDASLDGLLAAI